MPIIHDLNMSLINHEVLSGLQKISICQRNPHPDIAIVRVVPRTNYLVTRNDLANDQGKLNFCKVCRWIYRHVSSLFV